LQRNKVKKLVGRVALIHSVDSLDLAHEIERVAREKNIIQNVLLQIHLAQETTKTGLHPDTIEETLTELNNHKHLKVVGLMTMSTLTPNRELIRHEYEELKNLQLRINHNSLYHAPLTELSMGMSHDFDIAIAAGATLIRIGSDLFGARS
jgi:pyridoxal phosphate enzyme (YggS family)